MVSEALLIRQDVQCTPNSLIPLPRAQEPAALFALIKHPSFTFLSERPKIHSKSSL